VQFIPTQRKLPAPQRRLLELFGQLGAEDQNSLLAFAEFLLSREPQQAAADETTNKTEPEPIPRPDSESVVKAIKRLSATYPMLDSKTMLDETSSLMMAHVIQGRDALSVIDELEVLFERHYQRYLDQD
jgi:hypothetical protein